MKTTIKAKIVVETSKFTGFSKVDRDINIENEITLSKIREEINKGHYVLEWINSDLASEVEPTLIIKI